MGLQLERRKVDSRAGGQMIRGLRKLWDATFGRPAIERAEKEKWEQEEREYQELNQIKLGILTQPGEQSFSSNANLNGKSCVCTETYVDGVRTKLLYDFGRERLTIKELEAEYRGQVTFVE